LRPVREGQGTKKEAVEQSKEGWWPDPNGGYVGTPPDENNQLDVRTGKIGKPPSADYMPITDDVIRNPGAKLYLGTGPIKNGEPPRDGTKILGWWVITFDFGHFIAIHEELNQWAVVYEGEG